MKRRSSPLSKTVLKRIMEQAQLSNAAAVNFNWPTGEKVEILLNKESNAKLEIKVDENFTI